MSRRGDPQKRRDYFDVYGPFEIPRSEGEIRRPGRKWWREQNDSYDMGELSGAAGCYLFCLQSGTRFRPWYVGMTIAEAGFEGEVFTDHKLAIYNECVADRRGRPVLFLFPLVVNADYDEYRFSRARSSKKTVIGWLEKTLMGMAYAQNPEISNVRDMTRLKTVTVRGIMGKRAPGRRHDDVRRARPALFGR